MKNKGLKIFLSLMGGLLVIVLIISVIFYNNLVQAEESVNDKWTELKEQYQNRTMIVPDLVNSIKMYPEFNNTVLEEVAGAGSKLDQFNSSQIINDDQEFLRYHRLQVELSRALTQLLFNVENFPTVKSNERFQQLKARLDRTENRISVAKKDFNNEAKEFNVYIKLFPTSFFSEIFNFQEKPYFTSAPAEKTVTK